MTCRGCGHTQTWHRLTNNTHLHCFRTGCRCPLFRGPR